MFNLPDAKRVRRVELHSQSASPEPSEPDAELDALLKAQLARLYGPVFNIETIEEPLSKSTSADPAANGGLEGAPRTGEEEFEFRLFAANPSSNSATDGKNVSNVKADGAVTTKIILDAEGEEPLEGRGGFTVPSRNPAYYFALPAEGERKREFELAAVTGEDVRRWLDVRYSGWEMPWRVRVVNITSKGSSAKADLRLKDKNDISRISSVRDGNQFVLDNDQYSGIKKKKPSKKRRIHLRMKKRAEEEKKERRRTEQQMKEEAESEKRTRRNREKKVKKKMREKAKKVASSERTDDPVVGNGADARDSQAAS